MMQPNSYPENQRQLLARVHAAYVHAQLESGIVHIADVRRELSHAEPERIIRACSMVVLRAEHDMAIALALGDASVPRLDELVLAQVRDLLGPDIEHAVRARIVALDGRWPLGDIAPWPSPLTPHRIERARAPWYLRALAWCLRGRS